MHKISEDIFDDFMDNNDAELDEFLNDTVEIIEDNDKLECLKMVQEDDILRQPNIQEVLFKINEIIDHINKIEEKLDER
jgi:hypothetical protein